MRSKKLYRVFTALLISVLLMKTVYYNQHDIGSILHEPRINNETKLHNEGYGPYKFNLSTMRVIETDATMSHSSKDWKKALYEIAKDLRYRKNEYECLNKTWRGNWLDCNTFPFVVNKPCLVYSFGINYDFSHEDAFAAHGCEVFSFDPSMGDTKEHIQKSGAYFFPIGLAGTTKKAFSPRVDKYTKRNQSQKWETKTLRDIMILFGHHQRHLDYLKMDIEFYEWDAIETILKDNLTKQIKQIGLEFHIFPDTPRENFVRYLKTYKMFKTKGFRRFSGNILADNVRNRHFQCDSEFVNLKFDFVKYRNI